MKNTKLLMAVLAISFMLFAGCDNGTGIPAFNPNPDLAEVDSTVACDDPPIRNWLLKEYGKLGSLEAVQLVISGELKIDDLAFWHTVYFENSSANQFFGPNGEYTDQINTTFNDLKRFWDVELDNIILVSYRGSMLQDRNKVISTYEGPPYGYKNEKANAYADSISTLFELNPRYQNGNNPVFSNNQFALPDTTFAGVGSVPAKIIIGDGLLQSFDGIGYGDIAPQAILAHEIGHHIQYDLGVLIRGMQRGKELIPKTSRRIELMADAYASYYLSHPRVAEMHEGNIERYLKVFFNLGDCIFNIDSHHGTPNQREAAAQWGYDLAQDADHQDHILPIKELARLFDADLDNILKLTL